MGQRQRDAALVSRGRQRQVDFVAGIAAQRDENVRPLQIGREIHRLFTTKAGAICQAGEMFLETRWQDIRKPTRRPQPPCCALVTREARMVDG